MADDNEQRRLDPEAAVAPNRDRRAAPPIIEGEARAQDEAASAAGQKPSKTEEPTASAPRHEPPTGSSQPGAAPRRRSGLVVAAVLGGLVGAVVAAAVLWFERSTVEAGLAERAAALEAPITDLTRRVSALEAGAQDAKSSAGAVKALQGDIQAARADAAKALGLAARTAASVEQRKDVVAASAADLNAIDERLKKLESASPAPSETSADLSPIEDRLAKIEAALAAPKSETRVAPENGPGRNDGIGLAVAAEAVSGRLASGGSYAAEESALERLGADPAKLAALKPFAEKGAPTAATLAAGFAKVAPDALSAAQPKQSGGVIDRLVSNMSKVVKIAPVGATAGDDPAALVSQIAAALDHGDIGAAMTLWARLPEPARRASQDWAAAAQARLAADAAAQGVLNDAMAKLAAGDKH